MAKGPSKFIWAGLQFVRGPHPRRIPKNCWFHDPLKLAVVETRAGRFTGYAELTPDASVHGSGGCYSLTQRGALDSLLLHLQVEQQLAHTIEVRIRAAELIDEIEESRRPQ